MKKLGMIHFGERQLGSRRVWRWSVARPGD
jgi:hypothetical protein